MIRPDYYYKHKNENYLVRVLSVSTSDIECVIIGVFGTAYFPVEYFTQSYKEYNP
jgi:hypothetical protein